MLESGNYTLSNVYVRYLPWPEAISGEKCNWVRCQTPYLIYDFFRCRKCGRITQSPWKRRKCERKERA